MNHSILSVIIDKQIHKENECFVYLANLKQNPKIQIKLSSPHIFQSGARLVVECELSQLDRDGTDEKLCFFIKNFEVLGENNTIDTTVNSVKNDSTKQENPTESEVKKSTKKVVPIIEMAALTNHIIDGNEVVDEVDLQEYGVENELSIINNATQVQKTKEQEYPKDYPVGNLPKKEKPIPKKDESIGGIPF